MENHSGMFYGFPMIDNALCLFQYCGDQDDKSWLYESHHMPATGGKAYLLLVDDINELANSAEYK